MVCKNICVLIVKHPSQMQKILLPFWPGREEIMVPQMAGVIVMSTPAPELSESEPGTEHQKQGNYAKEAAPPHQSPSAW